MSDRMPELHLINVIVGYLTYRVNESGQDQYRSVSPSNISAVMLEELRKYEKKAGKARSDLPAAMGHILVGVVEASKAYASGPDIESTRAAHAASAQFEHAVRLIPADAAARNLAAVTAAYACCNEPPESTVAARVIDAFVKALALDAQNLDVVSNLDAFYAMLRAEEFKDIAPFAPAELNRRQASIQQLVQHYEVSGYNSEEQSVYGEVDAYKNSNEVAGYIYYENGEYENAEAKYIWGEWTGEGEIEAYDEDGNYLYLYTD